MSVSNKKNLRFTLIKRLSHYHFDTKMGINAKNHYILNGSIILAQKFCAFIVLFILKYKVT